MGVCHTAQNSTFFSKRVVTVKVLPASEKNAETSHSGLHKLSVNSLHILSRQGSLMITCDWLWEVRCPVYCSVIGWRLWEVRWLVYCSVIGCERSSDLFTALWLVVRGQVTRLLLCDWLLVARWLVYCSVIGCERSPVTFLLLCDWLWEVMWPVYCSVIGC